MSVTPHRPQHSCSSSSLSPATFPEPLGRFPLICVASGQPDLHTFGWNDCDNEFTQHSTIKTEFIRGGLVRPVVDDDKKPLLVFSSCYAHPMSILVVDVLSGKHINMLSDDCDHGGSIWCLCPIPSTDLVVHGDISGEAFISNWRTSKCVATINRDLVYPRPADYLFNQCSCALYHPIDKTLFVGGRKREGRDPATRKIRWGPVVAQYSLDLGVMSGEFELPRRSLLSFSLEGPVREIVMLRDRNCLGLAIRNNFLLWDPREQFCVNSVNFRDDSSLKCLYYAADLQVLACGTSTGPLRLLDLRKTDRELSPSKPPIIAPEIAPVWTDITRLSQDVFLSTCRSKGQNTLDSGFLVAWSLSKLASSSSGDSPVIFQRDLQADGYSICVFGGYSDMDDSPRFIEAVESRARVEYRAGEVAERIGMMLNDEKASMVTKLRIVLLGGGLLSAVISLIV